MTQSDTHIPNLWDWALEFYAKPNTAETLLRLQDDRHYSVILILWCLWAERYCAPLTTKSVQKLLKGTTSWEQEVIKPLRSIRRRMKQLDSSIAKNDAKSFRRAVKDMELEAEKLQLSRLQEMTHEALKMPEKRSQNEIEIGDYFKLYQKLFEELESTENYLHEESPQSSFDDYLVLARHLT